VAFVVAFSLGLKVAARVIRSPLSVDPQCLAGIFDAAHDPIARAGGQE
jgi:hypothetical protein